MSQTQTPEELDLEYARLYRKKIIDTAFKGGSPPSDLKELSIVLQALDGIDRAALGKLRLKSDDRKNDIAESAKGIIAELLNDPRAKTKGLVKGLREDTPSLPDSVPAASILPGEFSTSISTDSFAQFEQRNGMTSNTSA